MIATSRPYRPATVFIGTVPLGGDYPLRIQSMTNTDTLDTKATVEQCIKIIEAGADYVRLTARDVKEARNLEAIKNELIKRGYSTPLIADIHFNPAAAETAAAIIEKVRINPGNYADKRKIPPSGINEKEYLEELERIHSRLLPLIEICRRNKTAIRIGVNHGSLSERIIFRYGNTPEGMVVSALEFIRIFRSENFHSLVVSMKSSDTAVMITANRLLVKMMQEEGFAYPIHLGVTEAGEGEDGVVRSAAGIGTLLAEGIGDTIRVSLTGNPEEEIPVARKLADFFPKGMPEKKESTIQPHINKLLPPAPLRKINGPIVLLNMSHYSTVNEEIFTDVGYRVNSVSGRIEKVDGAADLIIASGCPKIIPEGSSVAVPHRIWMENSEKENLYPIFPTNTWPDNTRERSPFMNIILTGSHTRINQLKKIDPATSLIVFIWKEDENKFAPDRFLRKLSEAGRRYNVILNPMFGDENIEDLRIKAAALLGGYLNDRLIAGISVTGNENIGAPVINRLCFSILQCTGLRITRTIYISCPTCGRTKFNLPDALKKVKEKTSHLKGLKIAVMGCIVNGPGEMAGADWGYVGAGPGKVHIYKGTRPVLKNVDEKRAADELIRLIEEDQAKR